MGSDSIDPATIQYLTNLKATHRRQASKSLWLISHLAMLNLQLALTHYPHSRRCIGLQKLISVQQRLVLAKLDGYSSLDSLGTLKEPRTSNGLHSRPAPPITIQSTTDWDEFDANRCHIPSGRFTVCWCGARPTALSAVRVFHGAKNLDHRGIHMGIPVVINQECSILTVDIPFICDHLQSSHQGASVA